MKTIAIEERYGISFCKRQELAIERGDGSWVWDEEGRPYLDFTSGWGVTCLGHSHPVIIEAITRQAAMIIQNPNSGFTYSPPRAALLLALKPLLPAGMSKIYFANSGAEANDAAIKLARKITGRPGVVSTVGSFHGRTFNTLSVSGNQNSVQRYLPQLPHNQFVRHGDAAAVAAVLDENTAAVIVEPIQGEGGVRLAEPDYLPALAEICARNKSLLLVDEIQTGFCRTGRMFALEYSSLPVTPDILTMGKGIAGGFPFAAFAVTEAVAGGIEKGDHGGTFCGNPLGSAVAAAVVGFLQQQEIARRVDSAGTIVLQELECMLEEIPELLVSVRGKGLLCALELVDEASVDLVTQACLERGLLVTPTRGRVIRLIPSLLVSNQELRQGLSILREALAASVTRL
jgi:acetylornithine/N-succinyldiaminopimelate aminotransferase